ncbi:nicotinate-nucleotide--dimethylbenzimidazole phosphoribosyltransferase [Corynebacterium urinipleomorphum]|uniref:nicotinate-nucleotide--dimethylbenzimidazole phosphoribosyltransferase n=1 Tax=Corynebacterium urinipleomorphum TaxID=1852380 RepID=UPI000B34D8BE|nr:nicotinate-nucleotide--dimethylbenzimidazole phosphoribosyltransferase [Corynebacterium urinipleomorphum]
MSVSLHLDAVPLPDTAVEARVRAAMTENPRGISFGRLASLGAWFAGRQGDAPPQPISSPRVVIFAGDHGIAERGLSAFTPDASALQADEIDAGAAPVNTLARAAGAPVELIRVSLKAPSSLICEGSGAIDVEDAMSEEQFLRAAELGRAVADRTIDAGCDLAIAGDVGVGNTTVMAALIGSLTFTEPVVAVGRGSGINDEVWKVKVAAVRDSMFRVREVQDDVAEVMRRISSPDFVALTAFIAQCASRRTPVLIDGAFPSAAAYTAERITPGVKEWLIASQLTPEPCHKVCLQALDLTPVAALDMTTGQGAGGTAVLPLITSAVELVADEMRSQDGAGDGAGPMERR